MGKLELDKLVLAIIVTSIIVFGFTILIQTDVATIESFITSIIGFSIIVFLAIVAINKFIIKNPSLAVFVGAFIGSNILVIVSFLLNGTSLMSVIDIQLQLFNLINGVFVLGVLTLTQAIANKMK